MMIVGGQVRAKACPDLRPIAIPLNLLFPKPSEFCMYLVVWFYHYVAKDYE